MTRPPPPERRPPDELWALRAEHADTPPLSPEEVTGVLGAMSGQLAGIVDAEAAAVRSLGALLGPPD